jgi:hypothetical protein
MFRRLAWVALATLPLLHTGAYAAELNAPFRFESIKSLDDMAVFIRERFPLGSSRDELRAAFVAQGEATLRTHPEQAGVEKYVYDINLCDWYIWRWNISADYDAHAKLLQAYVNGRVVFPNGTPQKGIPKHDAKNAGLFSAARWRPEAYKGESSIAYFFYDADGDPNTTHDQWVVGGGHSRADPMDMGNIVAYAGVELWRSIFDYGAASRIARYQGDCAAADVVMRKRAGILKPNR